MRIKGSEPNPNQPIIKQAAFTVKELTEEGKIIGFASTYEDVMGPGDSWGDVMAPGCFVEWLANNKGRRIPMLWQHKTSEPIGYWPVDEMVDGPQGLQMTGYLTMAVERARECHALLKDQVLGGLSIGGYYRGWERPPEGSKADLIITKFDLYETSPVTFPANTSAVVTQVKAATESPEFSAAVAAEVARQLATKGAPEVQDEPAQITVDLSQTKALMLGAMAALCRVAQ